MTVGSLFAGIGGFDLGFERSGFEVRWQVERDGKAVSVLSRRFPNAEIYDDIQTVGAGSLEPVDVICGGFPCQDVSVAGKRAGLAGVRTGLFWEVVRIARELEPRWMVLENVSGLLSSNSGRDFHTVLSALAELGFRRAYRILDSRYFGVAQRRRRVFIVLRARRCGDGAEAVLFESARSNGDSPAGEEARSDVAATLRGRSHGAGVNMPGRGGEDDTNLVSVTLQGNSGGNHIEDPYIAYTLRDNGRNTSQGPGNYDDDTGALIPTLNVGVRRLTPYEREILQGFPPGWTCGCGNGHRGSRFCTCSDSHRYRQLGNAVTVPVAAWIARRILEAEFDGQDRGYEVR